MFINNVFKPRIFITTSPHQINVTNILIVKTPIKSPSW